MHRFAAREPYPADQRASQGTGDVLGTAGHLDRVRLSSLHRRDLLA